MMDLRMQRRLAAQLLKCGENRVYMNPEEIEEISKAVTRRDVENLIRQGLIKARKKRGNSRGRIRKRMMQKAKGRRKGHGSRKGKATARLPRKRRWIQTIRPIRAYLRELKEKGLIDRSTYRRYYMRAKGGQFKSKAHLKLHMEMEGVLKNENV
ncbi:MAG: 50S ribosomal protein L19e [Thermoplasmata archaeon]|nr:MAG: 50S ribosomal protein L19e [Thermoplasmata archaeon]KAA0009012.1 MAG: 50S ribosomal protein L19e [Thermoplasmata archaeon]MCD6572614.1 50S ribosomal protein L19e [Thermoplasmata archaeon]